MSLESEYLEAFEVHSPEGIRAALAAGASPTAPIKGKRPIDILIEMYTRSPRFAECIAVMLQAGAVVGDPMLEAILLDDGATLEQLLAATPQKLYGRLDILGAYTSCKSVSPLHICAEFNSVRCADALIKAGMDVNVRAGVDPEGFGGQTPLFHAVNSNQNYCRPVMDLLVEAGADLDIRLQGLVWGETFPWETWLFDITPISYAQCGLYRQFHRREEDVYSNIEYLYRRRHGKQPTVRNVPNQYLSK